MKDNAPITMKDIAEALGVSVATVSRALKDSPRISAEKREAIKAYAVHPAHLAVAETKVKPFTIQRVCLDYVI
jgi:transcriptional regulator with XRE-family HTH domain